MKETLEGTEELCFPQLFNSSCRRTVRPVSEAVLLHMLLSSIALLTVALNLLVIISISHFRQLHTPTNLFLLSLAVSDLLVGLVVMPIQILITLGTCWFLGDVMCALFYIVMLVITSASVGSMVLISVDRYVAICYPLHYPTKITQRRVQICVCLCWITSLFYNCLIVKEFLIQPDRDNSCYGECMLVINYISGAVDVVFTFIIPVTVIVALYMTVFVVAVSQARAMQSHVTVIQRGKVTVTAKKSERKAARTLGILIIVFLMCFCPHYCYSLAGQVTTTNGSFWVLYLNSCLNPVIYSLFYPWFRKAIKLIFTLQILKPDSCETKIL